MTRYGKPGLVNKLKQCGIDGTLLKWYTSYLLDRKQRVVISGESSDSKRLHAGVPILGPLLFLVYFYFYFVTSQSRLTSREGVLSLDLDMFKLNINTRVSYLNLRFHPV